MTRSDYIMVAGFLCAGVFTYFARKKEHWIYGYFSDLTSGEKLRAMFVCLIGFIGVVLLGSGLGLNWINIIGGVVFVGAGVWGYWNGLLHREGDFYTPSPSKFKRRLIFGLMFIGISMVLAGSILALFGNSGNGLKKGERKVEEAKRNVENAEARYLDALHAKKLEEARKLTDEMLRECQRLQADAKRQLAIVNKYVEMKEAPAIPRGEYAMGLHAPKFITDEQLDVVLSLGKAGLKPYSEQRSGGKAFIWPGLSEDYAAAAAARLRKDGITAWVEKVKERPAE